VSTPAEVAKGAEHLWRHHRRDLFDLGEVVAWIAGFALAGSGVLWLAAHL
jgi:hypothetical protein